MSFFLMVDVPAVFDGQRVQEIMVFHGFSGYPQDVCQSLSQFWEGFPKLWAFKSVKHRQHFTLDAAQKTKDFGNLNS